MCGLCVFRAENGELCFSSILISYAPLRLTHFIVTRFSLLLSLLFATKRKDRKLKKKKCTIGAEEFVGIGTRGKNTQISCKTNRYTTLYGDNNSGRNHSICGPPHKKKFFVVSIIFSLASRYRIFIISTSWYLRFIFIDAAKVAEWH